MKNIDNCLKFIKDVFDLDNVKVAFAGTDACVDYETDTIMLPADMPPETVFGVLASLVGTLLHTDKEMMQKCDNRFQSHLMMTIENCRVEKILRETYPILIDYLDEANAHFGGKVDEMLDLLPRPIQFIVAIRKTLEGKTPVVFEFGSVLEAVKDQIERLKTVKSTDEALPISKEISEISLREFVKLLPRIEPKHGDSVFTNNPPTIH